MFYVNTVLLLQAQNSIVHHQAPQAAPVALLALQIVRQAVHRYLRLRAAYRAVLHYLHLLVAVAVHPALVVKVKGIPAAVVAVVAVHLEQ